MEMQETLVSVLMTSYNREKYIAEAIESVLSSSYKNFELIIVDDGSTDTTLAIAKKYEAEDPRIKVYQNEKNLGDYQNRNKAAAYASGKYLKYLDSDDTIYDFGLAYCVAEMEKYPDADLGMYYQYEMDDKTSDCWSSEKIVKEHFFVRQYLSMGPTGTIIKRERFLQTGGFDVRFGVASDMFFNIRMASVSPIVLLPKLFVYYRVHEEQENKNQKGYLKYSYLYFKELLEKVQLPLTAKEIKYLYRKMKKRHSINLTKYYWRTKDLKSVKEIMKETNFSFAGYLTSFFK